MGKKSRMKWINRELKEEQKKNKGKKWLLGIFTILLLTAMGLGGYLGYIKFWKGKEKSAENKIDNQIAVLDTNMGIIKFRLYASAAPKTVENFIGLANKGFYDGVKFHRIIQDFMIQTGDPLSKDDTQKDLWGTGGESFWGGKFNDEINVWNLGLTPDAIKSLQDKGYQYDRKLDSFNITPGVVAMANSGPNTNGSQFFIVTEQPQPHLDGMHTAFGRVIIGMDVVRKIAAIKTDSNNRPEEPVIVNKVTIEKDESKIEDATKTNNDGVKVETVESDGTVNIGDIKLGDIKLEKVE